MAGMWLVETVLFQAIFLFTGGVEADPVTHRKSGKQIAFALVALDLGRYLPVSLFFMLRV